MSHRKVKKKREVKMDFGKYATVDNVTYEFEKDPEMKWVFRPVTTADEIEMQRWIAKKSKADEAPSMLEVAHKQLSIVSQSAVIPGCGLENGGSRVQFEELLNAMPLEMMGELWQALGEVSPLWGPPRPAASRPATNQMSEV